MKTFVQIRYDHQPYAKVDPMRFSIFFVRQLALSLILTSLGVNNAHAQLWESVQSTSSQNVLKDFQKQGRTLSKKRTKITLDVVANQVVGLLIEGPPSAASDMAYGVLAAIKGNIKEHHAVQGSIRSADFLKNARKGFKSPLSQSGAEFLAVKLKKKDKKDKLESLHIYIGINILEEKDFVSTQNSLGSSKAPHIIHILSDFQCPACRHLWDKRLSDWRKQPKKYRIYYHHFPLNYHKNAFSAAEASECAAQQEKFWPFADQLFKRFTNWNRTDAKNVQKRYINYAKSIGLDHQAFTNCLKKQSSKKEVQRQMQVSQPISVTGTPTVYMNGIKLRNMSKQELSQIAKLTSAQPNAKEVIQKRLKSLQLSAP